jgi:phosphoglycerate dehydrogenase-like enzyme
MRLSVHWLQPRSEALLSRLLDQLDPGIDLTYGACLPTATAFQILIASRPSLHHLAASPELRALIIPGAGLTEDIRVLMRDFPGVSVHNMHHNAAAVAEMTIALMLAAAKFIVPIDRTFRQHDWELPFSPDPSLMMGNKVALVLGYGAVGRRVAAICQGLSMRVDTVRRHASSAYVDFGINVHPLEALHRLLPGADALLICLPDTGETRGLIGERELGLLPSRAVLVNVGRGPIVEEAALFHALRDGSLYAAGLDVWYRYPSDPASRSNTRPSAYPFHDLDNVVMSPHRAGRATEAQALRVDELAIMLNMAARGEEMPNKVDLEAGY